MLHNVLAQKVGFGVVTSTLGDKQIRLVGRVPQPQIGTWLLVMERLLVGEKNAAWNVDISKQYFMRGAKLLYGWRVIFRADGIAQHLNEIAQVIQTTPMVQRQLDEVALHGGVDRTSLRGGKGAQPMFTAVVGAAAQRQM